MNFPFQVNLGGAIDSTSTAVNTLANQAATGPKPLSVWDLTVQGGIIMIPLAIMSVIAVYIFVERLLAISRAGKIDKNFMNNIRDHIKHGKIDSAKAMCNTTNTPLARMIEKGISRIGRPLDDISAAIENVAKLEVSKLEAKMALLATISGAAPMLGFLGTVVGMIKSLYNMAESARLNSGTITVEALSGGIYEAMVTTVGGLV
ncbi:MAG TPA: MotA/TolQ/ExbB proton channel family protein, partial [Bacteroidia bacterium]